MPFDSCFLKKSLAAFRRGVKKEKNISPQRAQRTQRKHYQKSRDKNTPVKKLDMSDAPSCLFSPHLFSLQRSAKESPSAFRFFIFMIIFYLCGLCALCGQKGKEYFTAESAEDAEN
jgi:hypothetical protein